MRHSWVRIFFCVRFETLALFNGMNLVQCNFFVCNLGWTPTHNRDRKIQFSQFSSALSPFLLHRRRLLPGERRHSPLSEVSRFRREGRLQVPAAAGGERGESGAAHKIEGQPLLTARPPPLPHIKAEAVCHQHLRMLFLTRFTSSLLLI